jgi:hypothetical protein
VTAIHARRLFEEKRSATEQPPRHDQVVAEHRDHDIDPERDHDVYGHKWLFIKWVHRQSFGVCGLKFLRNLRLARLSNDSYQKSLRDDYVRLMRQILIYARA